MSHLKTFFTTFLMVFLAELGDKTQLTTLLMAAHNESLKSVFLGASLALIASSFIGVCLGGYMSRFLPESLIHSAAGISFIIIGILLLAQKF